MIVRGKGLLKQEEEEEAGLGVAGRGDTPSDFSGFNAGRPPLFVLNGFDKNEIKRTRKDCHFTKNVEIQNGGWCVL